MRFGKGTRAMEKRKAADVAAALYAALAAGDRAQLDALLHPEFTGRTAEGMPFGIGGDHDSPAAMRRNAWGAIARHFEARAEPDRFLDLVDGSLLVTGRFRGRDRDVAAEPSGAWQRDQSRHGCRSGRGCDADRREGRCPRRPDHRQW